MKATDLAGRPFPDVALPGLDGKRQRLVLGASGACVIGLGHSECGTTRLTLPYLKRMHDRRGPGASVVVVLQDDAAAARALLAPLPSDLPVRLEGDPYPLARATGLTTVPTLFLIGPERRVERVCEGFERAAIEAMAGRLGIDAPFFDAEDKAPALRPG